MPHSRNSSNSSAEGVPTFHDPRKDRRVASNSNPASPRKKAVVIHHKSPCNDPARSYRDSGNKYA
jgi:hypothetical protein